MPIQMAQCKDLTATKYANMMKEFVKASMELVLRIDAACVRVSNSRMQHSSALSFPLFVYSNVHSACGKQFDLESERVRLGGTEETFKKLFEIRSDGERNT